MLFTMNSVEPLRLAAEWERRPRAAPQALRDYAFLADGWRGALLDSDGGVAWLCFPTYSSGAVFSGLLGRAGTYQLAPSARHVTGGYYEDGTLIWHQRWVTDDGIVESCDALAYPGEKDRCVLLRRIQALKTDWTLECTSEAGTRLRPAPRWLLASRDSGGWLLDGGS